MLPRHALFCLSYLPSASCSGLPCHPDLSILFIFLFHNFFVSSTIVIRIECVPNPNHPSCQVPGPASLILLSYRSSPFLSALYPLMYPSPIVFINPLVKRREWRDGRKSGGLDSGKRNRGRDRVGPKRGEEACGEVC